MCNLHLTIIISISPDTPTSISLVSILTFASSGVNFSYDCIRRAIPRYRPQYQRKRSHFPPILQQSFSRSSPSALHGLPLPWTIGPYGNSCLGQQAPTEAYFSRPPRIKHLNARGAGFRAKTTSSKRKQDRERLIMRKSSRG